MPLVTKDEISKLAGLNRLGLGFLAPFIMWLIKLRAVNNLYDSCSHKEDVPFIDCIFGKIGVNYEYFEDELRERIPKEGPFIIVANHPLGTIDGMILIQLITKIRPDFKVMANFLLQHIEPISHYFLPVNPFEKHKDKKSSVNGMKEAMLWVKQGHGMGIFPSGQVATYRWDEKKITEKPWSETAIRLIQKLAVPVVPVYFKAKLRKRFYFFAFINGIFRTALMPSELFNARKRSILVRIGKAIDSTEYLAQPSIDDLRKLFRERTYRLSNTLEESRIDRIKKHIDSRLTEKKNPKPIISETPQYEIWEEIEKLREAQGARLTIFRTYEVFCAEAKDIPKILREISRQREITFREVGEGTNEPCDIDEYDYQYLHLFLWDNDTQKIVGAYRLGMGADIYANKGIEGFYVNSLFKIDEKIHPLFKGSLEMGRAYIIKEYQAKPMPLFLLWKGIMHVILRNPDKVRYLTGCVSISNHFSKYSKGMMIAYVKRHFYDHELAEYIIPRKEYKVRLDEDSKQIIETTSAEDINKFDRYIDEIEPGSMRFPVLLKKYVKQNAKIVAFNVDPNFNNAIDGFMYIDINDLPEQTIKPVAEELEEAAKDLVKKQGK